MKRKNHSSNTARGNEAKGKAVEEESYGCCRYFDKLPTDLTGKILIKLPIKSLLICRCVCKTWKTLILEQDFAKMHFQQSPVSLMIRTRDEGRVSRTLYLLECDSEKLEIGSNQRLKLQPMFKLPLRDAKSFWVKRDEIRNRSNRPVRAVRLVSEKNYENTEEGSENLKINCMPSNDRFKIANSCNGLLCLSDPSNLNPLVICNPVTGEFVSLPEATKTPSRFKTIRVNINGGAALGFLPKTEEYKVIKMWGHGKPANHRVYERVILHVNTIGTPSWRNVEVDPQISISRLKYATCLNGVLHWIRYVDWQRSILCFCLESEMLQSFPSPPGVFETHDTDLSSPVDFSTMGELKGFLYISDLSYDHNVTMWVMNEYGIGESWTKVYNIDIKSCSLGSYVYWYFGYFWPIKQFEEDVAILLYPSHNCFVYYEPEKCRFKFLQIHGTRYGRVEVIPHIPSLISLKDVLKGHNIEVQNIHSRCAKFKLREETDVLSLSRCQRIV